MTEKENVVQSIFVTSKHNNFGIFGIKTYFNGEEQQIIVDNFIPCKNQQPVFSRANGSELWVLVLEKMWAKMHRSYQNIVQGHAYEVFRDLLGCPSFYRKVNEENFLDKIKYWLDQGYLFCVTS